MTHFKFCWSILCFLTLSLSLGVAIPKEKSKDRVLDKPLSDDEHYNADHEHNKIYDHEAFLGSDASTFDQLKPEESKKKLGEIFDKMDLNQDSYVDQSELKSWISNSQKSYIFEDSNRQWKSHNPDLKEKLSWDEYKKVTYGFLDELSESKPHDEDSSTYKQMMDRDKRRWDLADQDKDGFLTKSEFVDFLHPEESKHMKHVIVQETLEDIDKDKDGKLSMQEYISDMYQDSSSDSEVPEWVTREREQFKLHRDTNGDGFMDHDEIRDWIVPPDYDHSKAESSHLIQESDSNKDGKLSKQEVLDNYDLFVGSQATDFGEALVSHDEF